MNVFEYLLAERADEAPALLTLNADYTYGTVRKEAGRLAALLIQQGGRKGDRALLLADNGLFWVTAYLGILRAGLVCVPLPPKIAPDELAYIAGATEPAFIFADRRSTALARTLSYSARVITESAHNDDRSLASFGDFRIGGLNTGDFSPIGANDLAALMFTSGSTGRPRGVMISHGNIIANTNSIIEYLSLTAADRIMAVLPFHYCFGTSLLHTHFRVGGSVVIDSRFVYPELVLERMQATACTGFAGVPSHFQILLRKSSLARRNLPHLRYVQQAGGQLAPAFIAELRRALPDKRIFIMYGQTEATARLSFLPPECLDTKLGSIGTGMPGVCLRVLDHEGRQVAAGEVGEIVAESGSVGLGYWKDDAETARCFRNGSLYTGDLAKVDEDGFIYIVDRAKDFLKCGGKRISCRQLENVLLEHPALLESAVIGEPDEVLGEAAVAFLVARDAQAVPEAEELRSHCHKQLAPVFVPKRFVFVSSLPKNSSGKVLKASLKAQCGKAYSDEWRAESAANPPNAVSLAMDRHTDLPRVQEPQQAPHI